MESKKNEYNKRYILVKARKVIKPTNDNIARNIKIKKIKIKNKKSKICIRGWYHCLEKNIDLYKDYKIKLY